MIVLYNSLYFNNCLEIFKSNTPGFFGATEESLFVNYLSSKNITYFGLIKEKKLIGCGGYAYNHETNTVSLTWGMVASQFHNMGFGTKLLIYRLAKIKRDFSTVDITLNTSQKTYQFYKKFNFELEKISPDFYAKGLDRYDMRLKSV